MSKEVEKVGFIGLGVMGLPMATNLLKKGQVDLFVFDVNAEAVEQMQELGAKGCNSPAALAALADVVFLSLPNEEVVRDVCFGSEGLCHGAGRVKVVVDLSTTDVETTKEISARFEKIGISFVDAPVARMPEAAISGTLLIMVGGTTGIFDYLSPLLQTMGSDVVHCGPLGSGQVVKIINNFVLISNVRTLAEAMLIGEGQGIEAQTLFATLGLGSAYSKALEVAGLEFMARRFFPQGRFSACYALKDIGLAKRLAKAASVQTKVLDVVIKTLEQSALEHGDEYYAVMLKDVESKSEQLK